MSDDWDFYMLRVDDKPASIMVDLGIRSDVPYKTHPFMGYLRTRMNNPRPDGLSSQEEFETLSKLEDAVEAVFTDRDTEHVYVGRNTSDGNRDFYFYTQNLDKLHSKMTHILEEFSNYEFEQGGRADENWEVYLGFLFPSPVDFQRIHNRRVCYNLEKHGDSLQQAREIDHRVYFKKKSNLKLFSEFLSQQKFEITGTGRTKPLVGDHFIDFKRIDYPNNIDEIVDEIFLKSVELDGDYDGWGCPVVTE